MIDFMMIKHVIILLLRQMSLILLMLMTITVSSKQSHSCNSHRDHNCSSNDNTNTDPSVDNASVHGADVDKCDGGDNGDYADHGEDMMRVRIMIGAMIMTIIITVLITSMIVTSRILRALFIRVLGISIVISVARVERVSIIVTLVMVIFSGMVPQAPDLVEHRSRRRISLCYSRYSSALDFQMCVV